MKFRTIVTLSIISGFTGLVIASLILPAFVSVFRTTLDILTITDVANLVGWFGFILIFFVFSGAIILLSRQYKSKLMFQCLLVSNVASMLLLSAGSFIYLAIVTPEIFISVSLVDKLVNFLSYPNIVAVYNESPQNIWTISTILQITLFNWKYYQVVEA